MTGVYSNQRSQKKKEEGKYAEMVHDENELLNLKYHGQEDIIEIYDAEYY